MTAQVRAAPSHFPLPLFLLCCQIFWEAVCSHIQLRRAGLQRQAAHPVLSTTRAEGTYGDFRRSQSTDCKVSLLQHSHVRGQLLLSPQLLSVNLTPFPRLQSAVPALFHRQQEGQRQHRRDFPSST